MGHPTISGRCLCGHIQYEYSGELGPASYCHCKDCRKVTGSAFVVSVRIDPNAFNITSANTTKRYTKTADNGSLIQRDFCPNCGSPIFTTSPDHPEFMWVRAGTLDNPGIVKPVQEYWTRSKVVWATIPGDIESFTKSRF